MMRRVASLMAMVVVVACACAQVRREAVRTTIGIEGRAVFRHPVDEKVQAVPVDDKAPIVVRIADRSRDGEYVLYDLRFIAQYAGEFDLRDCLRRPDGTPLTNAEPLPVSIGKLLPDDHQGALFEIGGGRLPRLGGYQVVLLVIGALWLAVPLVVARRMARPRPAPPPPVAPPRTLADQLRPLVESAMRGEMSVSDRARLEMLLQAYWRERLGLGAGLDQAGAMSTLRAHPRPVSCWPCSTVGCTGPAAQERRRSRCPPCWRGIAMRALSKWRAVSRRRRQVVVHEHRILASLGDAAADCAGRTGGVGTDTPRRACLCLSIIVNTGRAGGPSGCSPRHRCFPRWCWQLRWCCLRALSA